MSRKNGRVIRKNLRESEIKTDRRESDRARTIQRRQARYIKNATRTV